MGYFTFESPRGLVDGRRGGGIESGEWTCRSRDQIIPFEQRCDEELDCRDGSDEEECWGRARRAIRGNTMLIITRCMSNVVHPLPPVFLSRLLASLLVLVSGFTL